MRRAVVWISVLLVLLGAGYAGDTMLRGYVEDQVADAIATQLGADSTPTVSLGGVPFAFALVTRSVPEAHATLAAMPLAIAGHDVELTGVQARTGEIRLVGDAVHVATMTGSGSLGYDDLTTIAGVPVAHAGEGRLELRYSREVFGRDLSIAVSAVPGLDVADQVIRLTEPKLEVAGNDIDLNLTQEQLDAIVEPIDVHLDHGLRLTELRADDGGVQIGIGGEGLSAPVR